jgi:hypothetical protein
LVDLDSGVAYQSAGVIVVVSGSQGLADDHANQMRVASKHELLLDHFIHLGGKARESGILGESFFGSATLFCHSKGEIA